MPDESIPGTKRAVTYKKPAAGKFMTQGGSMVASMAAQRNMMPNQFTANTNPNEIQNQNQMKPSTFTMKYNKSSFPFKSSPAKDDPHKTTETHKTHEIEKKKDKNEYEKILLKQSDEGKKPLTDQEKTVLGKYRSRMFKNKKNK
jgi:hypothetical protein